ncbi:FxSxx-COOH system tetratricopeptide repeat protein [Actinosynnema sp. NPDC047251]|uniref:FxSxx-COOH system tetratricopeptide repeat protein n=1 Tax=Saccharothrix espanaensis TaxID=103731 RepID=UPI000688AB07|nr:FxSxx-COOH system tetratricopeptide repeat protein [Saccharothrix espanaensis]
MQWDFFVSYTDVDRAWAEWIAWELERSGHRVLVQAWDMVPGANWVDRMDEGVREAERTVAVLSAAYLSSVYGKAEWQAAWREDPVGERRKLVVLRIADCERPGLLAGIVSTDLFGLSETATRQRLLDTVRGVTVGRAKPGAPPVFPGATPRFPGAMPDVWNVPPRNPDFTGRAEHLDLLHRTTGTVAVKSVRGMGGVGKTQLATEYAYRYAGDFDVVWWIPSEQITAVPHHFADLGADLGLDVTPDKAVRAVHVELRRRGRWLLVFDNAEDADALRPYLPTGPGRVLITTRRSGFDTLGSVVDLDVMDRADSVVLLSRRLPDATATEAASLSELLGDLPLAVEQASAYIKATGLPVASYLDLLTTRTAEVIRQGKVAGHDRTLATLWDLSLAELGAAERRLLDLLAHLAPEPVPLDLFTLHPDALPAPLAETVTDPIAFNNTVGALVDHYLVRRSATEITVVHRLLGQSLRDRADPGGALGAAMALLVADLPIEIRGEPEKWPRWHTLLPHVLAVCAASPDADGPLVALLVGTGRHLHSQGLLHEALGAAERALAVQESLDGTDSQRIAVTLNEVGMILDDLDRSADALVLYQRAGVMSAGSFGGDHPYAAVYLANSANSLVNLGRSGEAVPLLERALAIYRAKYGPDHPEVAITLRKLGKAMRGLGRTAEVLPLVVRALEIDSAYFPPDHPTLVVSLNNVGFALVELDRATEAEPVFRRAMHLAETAYHPAHPYVAISATNLSVALAALGREAEARESLEKALRIRQQPQP